MRIEHDESGRAAERGVDSTTALAIAKRDGFDVYALSLRCGQTHAIGLDTARRVAAALGRASTLIG